MKRKSAYFEISDALNEASALAKSLIASSTYLNAYMTVIQNANLMQVSINLKK